MKEGSLRILHIHTLPIVSGSGINTLLTMKGSLAGGHRPALACESSGRLTDEATKEGIPVHLIPSLGRELHVYKDPAAVFALARLMRREHFDIVHTHNSKAGFIGRLAGRLAGVPVVVHTVHGFAFHDAAAPIRRHLFRIFERIAAHWCDGLIFISKPLEEWANREGIGRQVPRRVIYSGIDMESFRAAAPATVRKEFGVEPEQLIVGMVSKLWEGKGHKVLLRAWREIQQKWDDRCRPLLLIVGEGPLETDLKRLASDSGVSDTVKFAGFRADIPKVTAAIDIAVLPSEFEGMGRVILEAMAAGKPVVASRVGGIPDLVRDEVNGLLVEPNDTKSLAAALDRVLRDAALRRSLSQRAVLSLERKYSSDTMVDEVHAFYAYLSGRKSEVVPRSLL